MMPRDVASDKAWELREQTMAVPGIGVVAPRRVRNSPRVVLFGKVDIRAEL